MGISCASGPDCQDGILWNKRSLSSDYVLEITCFEPDRGSKNSQEKFTVDISLGSLGSPCDSLDSHDSRHCSLGSHPGSLGSHCDLLDSHGSHRDSHDSKPKERGTFNIAYKRRKKYFVRLILNI